MLLKLLYMLACTILVVEGANILALAHFPSKSHHILSSTLLKALAKRGHHVTMLSPFPLETPLENYEDIMLTGLIEIKEGSISTMVKNVTSVSFIEQMKLIMNFIEEVNHGFLTHPALKQLVSSNKTFDLVIHQWCENYAALALSHIFNASTIILSTVGSYSDTNILMGNTAPYSYVPNILLNFNDKMTFLERVANTLCYIAFEIFYNFYLTQQEQVRQQHFPNTPSLKELTSNVSLMLLNSHYSIESPRPHIPTMIQIGGFHVEEPKELKGDLKEFMDAASNGVIFFSLGSNVKSSDLPEDKLDGIIKCFQELPLKVLWKFETDGILKLPPNVKTGKWFPQRDILAHPNTKLFITHGGLLSTTEAIYHGVPMIGIPIFGDQESNVADGESRGYLIKLLMENLTQNKLCDAIQEILSNNKYSDNIKRRSKVLRDQPLKPLDNAVYWVEYVLRHNGAHHLKTTVGDLHWYQYYLLDVIVFLVGIISVVIVLIYFIVCWMLRVLRSLLCKSQRSSIDHKRNVKRKSKTKVT